MGDFQGAVALSQPGQPFAGDPSDALVSVRAYRLRPGVSLNLEQQVSETVGVFARAGWPDGYVEPWDNTDIHRTVEAGVSIIGKDWGGPTIQSASPASSMVLRLCTQPISLPALNCLSCSFRRSKHDCFRLGFASVTHTHDC